MNETASLLPPAPLQRGPVMTEPAAAPETPQPRLRVSECYALGSIHTLEGLAADGAGCIRFRAAMMDALEQKRADGRTGWNKPERCSIAQLEEHMNERVAAGDIVGVGIAAMMIWNRLNPEASFT